MSETRNPHSGSTPLTDSPWFWVLVFCGAGLLGTLAIGTKFSRRQAQIERKFQGRQRGEQAKRGQQPTTKMSEPESTWVSIGAVRWLLGIAFCVGWLIFWQRRRRAATPSGDAPGAADR